LVLALSQQVDRERLRELRDEALCYISSYGADKPKGQVPIIDLKAHLASTEDEYISLYLLLLTEGLAATDGMNLHICLTEKGRKETEKLDRPSAAAINIRAGHSVVQLGGSYQSEIISILDQIEHDLPRLGLEGAKREQAIGILVTLRKALLDKLPDAGIRVLAAALSDIITKAGSALGESLIKSLGI